MAKYDLTGSLETSFTFSINDQEFSFRKPTVREMRQLAKTFADVTGEQDQDKQVQLSEEAMNGIYSFITPVGHDANIADVMNDQTVSVQVAFNEMIQKELGAA